MNGVMAGIVAGILLLVATVVGVVASNDWNQSQQQDAQTFTQQQIQTAESQAAGQ
ncbi:MAG: hypothetical protein K6T83_00210 [Alicyclobacillus sp.]|nr:hypothetical protein [Alicyclobacillus sp.]